MDRLAWAEPGRRPDDVAVDDYVTGVVRGVVEAGVLVGTGHVHVGTSGRLVCDDVVVAARLELDQAALVRSILIALAVGDPVDVADAVAELCRCRPPRLASTAVAVARSLAARWTSLAFGLAVHGLGRAVVTGGLRSEPLVLLGDELLHRLDAAHEHHMHVPGLSSPHRVFELAAGRGAAL